MSGEKITAKNISLWAIIILLAVWGAEPGWGQVVNQNDSTLSKIDVIEHRGDTLPENIQLIDDTGQPTELGRYFDNGKPKILIMAYYSCPMLCNLVANGVVEAINKIGWEPGKQLQILTVSIDPKEDYHLAAAKKENYMGSLENRGNDSGWVFFTATGDQSRKLADAIGFKYFYDEKIGQYAHPAVITIVTDSGVISRYLYGIDFNQQDLKLSLLEAADGKIGTPLDKILLFCYHYDPDAGGYVVLAANVMKVGGIVTLIILALFLGFWWWRDIRRKNKTLSAAGTGHIGQSE